MYVDIHIHIYIYIWISLLYITIYYYILLYISIYSYIWLLYKIHPIFVSRISTLTSLPPAVPSPPAARRWWKSADPSAACHAPRPAPGLRPGPSDASDRGVAGALWRGALNVGETYQTWWKNVENQHLFQITLEKLWDKWWLNGWWMDETMEKPWENAMEHGGFMIDNWETSWENGGLVEIWWDLASGKLSHNYGKIDHF